MRKAFALGGLVLLAGCVSLSSEQSDMTPPRISTNLAGPQTVISPMPTAVVLLREGDELNDEICNGFFADRFSETSPSTRSRESSTGEESFENYVRTYWLLSEAKTYDNCDYLVENYDFARAKSTADELGVKTLPSFVLILPDGKSGLALKGDTLTQENAQDFTQQWSRVVSSNNGNVIITKNGSGHPMGKRVACSAFNFASAFFGGSVDNIAEWLFGEVKC